MFKKNSGYFYATTLKVIENSFVETFEKFSTDPFSFFAAPETFLKDRAHIVRLVARQKTIDDNATAKGYTTKDVRSSVHRGLTALIETEKIRQIWGKYYVPNTNDAVRIEQLPELLEIPYSKSNIFFASPKLILVPIKQLADGVNSEIKNIFRIFITEEYCYDVRITKHYITLMIDGPDEGIANIGKLLAETVQYCYDTQHPQKRTLHKEERTLKYAWVKKDSQTDKQASESEISTTDRGGPVCEDFAREP